MLTKETAKEQNIVLKHATQILPSIKADPRSRTVPYGRMKNVKSLCEGQR
jgi:hypothetical protein